MKPYEEQLPRPFSPLAIGASDDAREIAEDYSTWGGSLRDFFKYESARTRLAPTPIRRLLVILGMISVRSGKGPRYRGETTRCLPGSILVTDGKTVDVVFTGTGEIRHYNWQGIIDQATICHTAVVVTDTESAVDQPPSLYSFGSREWNKGCTEGVDWWPEEIPSEEDYENTCQNLNKVGWKVDYVISHTCPESQLGIFDRVRHLKDPTEVMLQKLLDRGLNFDSWHFGHFHLEREEGKFVCHFNAVRSL